MRITIGNAKGGVGKSTTALYLAIGLQRAGARVLLVDADPTNQSLMDWSRNADWPAAVVVVPWQDPAIVRRVDAVAADYDHVLIDTGPESIPLLKQALLVTDHLIVPVGPSPTELRQLGVTLAAAADVDTVSPVEVQVLLTRLRAGTRSSSRARQYLEQLGVATMTAEVRLREQIPMSWGTVDFDLGDYDQVLAELAGGVVAA